jgi:hypothetical protein
MRRRCTTVAAGALAALLAGCGGAARQDAREPRGEFPVQIVKSSFPAKQAVARTTQLELQVRNAGTRTIPTIAVTVDAFYYRSTYPNLADNRRPIWVIERGPGPVPEQPVETQGVSSPGGAETAYVNTWALGSLAPGATQTFTWRVTPVKPGRYTVHYRFAAGLSGRARATLPSGGPVTGQLTADIASRPPITHVDPNTGQVVAGRYTPTP